MYLGQEQIRPFDTRFIDKKIIFSLDFAKTMC
jgi:hypothetical protein